MRIIDLYRDIQRILGLVSDDKLMGKIATGRMTAEDVYLLSNRYKALYGQPLSEPLNSLFGRLSSSLASHDEEQAKQTASNIGSVVIAGAMHAFGIAQQATGASAFGVGLSLSQKLELRLSQSLQLTLGSFLSDKDYHLLYERSRKLHYANPELGLDFEVALLNRSDIPEFLSWGTPGFMIDGMVFVAEDFFVDLDENTKKMFIELVAIHEYGEVIFRNHHKATMLELAVAKQMGVIDKYLEFLESHALIKFRDLVLYRLKDTRQNQLRKGGINIEHMAFKKGELPIGDKSAEAAREIVKKFRIPKDIQKKYDAIDREDMNIVEEKVGEWIIYITALEQVEAFHKKALDDVQEAISNPVHAPYASNSVPLVIRMALFRVLGVLKYEIDENIIEIDHLSDELRAKLDSEFISELRNTVEGLIEERHLPAELLNDPIFSMDAGTMYELAKVDYQIWRALDLELRLTEESDSVKRDEDENENENESPEVKKVNQHTIEVSRDRGWQVAMDAGLQARDQIEALKGYVQSMKEFTRIKKVLKSVVVNIQRLNLSASEYADAEDLAYYLSLLLIYEIKDKFVSNTVSIENDPYIRNLIQTQLDASLPQIWQAYAGRNGFENVPFDAVRPLLRIDIGKIVKSLGEGDYDPLDRRLAKLSKRYESPRATPALRESIENAVFSTYKNSPIYGRHELVDFIKRRIDRVSKGILSETLASKLIRYELEKEPENISDYIPRVRAIPILSVMTGGSLDKIIDLERRLFIREIFGIGDSNPKVPAMALEGSQIIWDQVKSTWIGEAKTLFSIAKKNKEELPDLASALDGETPQSLWQKLNFRGALQAFPDSLEPDGEVKWIGSLKLPPIDIYPGASIDMSPRGIYSMEKVNAYYDKMVLNFLNEAGIIDIQGEIEKEKLLSREEAWRDLGARLRLDMLFFVEWVFGNPAEYEGHVDSIQPYIDIVAARSRQKIVQRLEKRTGVDASVIEWHLPAFGVNVGELIGIWKDEVAKGSKYDFREFLDIITDFFPSNKNRLKTKERLGGNWDFVRPLAERLPFPEVNKIAEYIQSKIDRVSARDNYDRSITLQNIPKDVLDDNELLMEFLLMYRDRIAVENARVMGKLHPAAFSFPEAEKRYPLRTLILFLDAGGLFSSTESFFIRYEAADPLEYFLEHRKVIESEIRRIGEGHELESVDSIFSNYILFKNVTKHLTQYYILDIIKWGRWFLKNENRISLKSIYNAQELSFMVLEKYSDILKPVPGNIVEELETDRINHEGHPVGARRDAVSALKTVLDYYDGLAASGTVLDAHTEEGVKEIRRLYESNRDATDDEISKSSDPSSPVPSTPPAPTAPPAPATPAPLGGAASGPTVAGLFDAHETSSAQYTSPYAPYAIYSAVQSMQLAHGYTQQIGAQTAIQGMTVSPVMAVPLWPMEVVAP